MKAVVREEGLQHALRLLRRQKKRPRAVLEGDECDEIMAMLIAQDLEIGRRVPPCEAKRLYVGCVCLGAAVALLAAGAVTATLGLLVAGLVIAFLASVCLAWLEKDAA